MKFVNQTPFFFLLSALVLGIITYQLLLLPLWASGVLIVLSIVLILFSFLFKRVELQYRFRWMFGVGVMFALIVLGYYSCLFFEKQHQFSDLNSRALYEVELISVPIEKTNSYQCKLSLLQRIDSVSTRAARGEAVVYFQKDSLMQELLIGDKLLVEAEFKSPDGVQNPHGFDYATYLKRQGVLATAYIAADHWKLSSSPPQKSLRRYAAISLRHLLDIYQEYKIDGDEFAVLAALTLGYQDDLQPDVKAVYSASGAAHILSVSGLHVGIVYAAIFFLLGFLRHGRKQTIIRAAIAMLFLWAYAFITGLSPAVVRSALMLSFVAVATMMERKSQIFNTVLISAFIMLLINPNLLFNISFQLSYAAVISIVAMQKYILRLYTPTNRALKWIWGLTAVSLAAQIGTAPIAIYYFNQFPNYFLLTNYIAIPLSTAIIYLAILLLCVSFLPLLPNLVGFILKWAIFLLNYALEKIVALPGAVSTISISYFQLWVISFSILMLLFYYIGKNRPAFLAGLLGLLIFFVSFAVRKHDSLSHSRLIVFSDSRVPIVNFIEGNTNLIATTDMEKAERVCGAYWKSMLLDAPVEIGTTKSYERGFVHFRGKRILVLTDEFLKNKTSAIPIKLDYLVVANRVKPNAQALLDCVNPKILIVDKSISSWYTAKLKEECVRRKITFYSVAERGAFVMDM